MQIMASPAGKSTGGFDRIAERDQVCRWLWCREGPGRTEGTHQRPLQAVHVVDEGCFNQVVVAEMRKEGEGRGDAVSQSTHSAQDPFT